MEAHPGVAEAHPPEQKELICKPLCFILEPYRGSSWCTVRSSWSRERSTCSRGGSPRRCGGFFQLIGYCDLTGHVGGVCLSIPLCYNDSTVYDVSSISIRISYFIFIMQQLFIIYKNIYYSNLLSNIFNK